MKDKTIIWSNDVRYKSEYSKYYNRYVDDEQTEKSYKLLQTFKGLAYYNDTKICELLSHIGVPQSQWGNTEELIRKIVAPQKIIWQLWNVSKEHGKIYIGERKEFMSLLDSMNYQLNDWKVKTIYVTKDNELYIEKLLLNNELLRVRFRMELPNGNKESLGKYMLEYANIIGANSVDTDSNVIKRILKGLNKKADYTMRKNNSGPYDYTLDYIEKGLDNMGIEEGLNYRGLHKLKEDNIITDWESYTDRNNNRIIAWEYRVGFRIEKKKLVIMRKKQKETIKRQDNKRMTDEEKMNDKVKRKQLKEYFELVKNAKNTPAINDVITNTLKHFDEYSTEALVLIRNTVGLSHYNLSTDLINKGVSNLSEVFEKGKEDKQPDVYLGQTDINSDARGFDWKAFFGARVAVHCKTKELAEDFCKELDKLNAVWYDKSKITSADTQWMMLGDSTCYVIDRKYKGTYDNKVLKSRVPAAKAHGYNVVDWEPYYYYNYGNRGE